VDGLWATKSEGVGLIAHAINFQDFQPMCSYPPTSRTDRLCSWSTNVTDVQTDRRHAISIPRFAL